MDFRPDGKKVDDSNPLADKPGDTPRPHAAVRDASAQPGTCPLILFSHSSGGRWRQSSFLCTHLASHGYLVAALNHSETIAPELGSQAGETERRLWARVDKWIANRVPDVRFLLATMLARGGWDTDAIPEPLRIAAIRHVRTLRAHAVAKQMVILRKADHGHFADEFEQQAGMSSKEEARLVIRGLTLCHFDAVLKQSADARRFLAGDIFDELAARSATVILHETGLR